MTRTPRRFAVSAGLAVLLLTGCGDARLQPGAAAIIGDTRITTDELQQTSDAGLADPQALEQLGGDRADFQRQVLSRLVRRELLAAAAQSRGVTVSDGDVARQIETFVEAAGSREALEQQAAQAGVSANQLEPFVRDIVLEQALGDELVSDVDVPRADLRALYEQNIGQYDQIRSRHILVEDEALGRDLLAQVQADPGRFEALAAANSIDTASAQDGGDLGLAPRGQFVPEFEELLYSLPIGDYGLVQTEFGWHVAQPIERITTPLAEATPELRRALLQDEAATRTSEVFRETSERLGITVNPRFGRWNPDAGRIDADDSPNGVLVEPYAPGLGVEVPGGQAPGGEAPEVVAPPAS